MTQEQDKKPQYPIRQDTYEWGLKLFSIAEKKLGININVYDDHDSIEDGQIFLFNHYARFETAIPPYIFYKKAGAYTRSVADHHLFEVNDKLRDFLIGAGAVPNNAEGLLPFMAAEILKGRKVVIFPEGGMIKDRRVMDDKGEYRIFSSTAETYRKHHRGAAILALTLDVFKRRILDLHSTGDQKRLEHWRDALELDSIDTLLTQAKKPTFVVPSTITFYPMRIRENALSRVAEKIIKNASPTFIEEMIVEGNILLRNTDMDIRFGKPLETHKKWHWWEKVLLRNYFLGVQELDELFALKHKAKTVSEHLLAKCISKEADAIRDLYMHRIYDGTTVNMAHVSSVIITQLLDANIHKVDCSTFNKMAHQTIKTLQDTPTVYLHKTIASSRCFRTILENKCTELARFIDLCQRANLVKTENGIIHFMPKLQKEHDSKRIRLENPVKVAYNEAEPVEELKEATTKAIKHVNAYTAETFAFQRFDDERRIYEETLTHFHQEKYDSINKRESATESGEPYLIVPKKSSRKNVGILMVHGFMSSPAELRNFADKMVDDNFTVMGVRLEGHGTSPWDLHKQSHEDWLNSVRRGYDILSGFVDEIVVVGFSTGGVLGLSLVAQGLPKIKAIASVCAPVWLQNRNIKFVGIVNSITDRFKNVPGIEENFQFIENKTSQPSRNYRTVSLKSVGELKRAIKQMKRDLDNVDVPVCVIQANEEKVVNPDSANYIYDKITVDEKEIHWIKTDKHGIISEDVGETHQLLKDFITRFVRKQ